MKPDPRALPAGRYILTDHVDAIAGDPRYRLFTWTVAVDGVRYRHVTAFQHGPGGWAEVILFDLDGGVKRDPAGKPVTTRLHGEVQTET